MSMADIGNCFECNAEVLMATASTDPMGRPLCSNCFNVLVKAGKQQDVDELV